MTEKHLTENTCHRTGRPEELEDISWPSSPIGVVSCTAFVLCHRTGRPEELEDISWPSSPIGTVSCTACVLSHRTGEADERKQRKRRRRGEEERKEGGVRGKSYNLHTDGGEKSRWPARAPKARKKFENKKYYSAT